MTKALAPGSLAVCLVAVTLAGAAVELPKKKDRQPARAILVVGQDSRWGGTPILGVRLAAAGEADFQPLVLGGVSTYDELVDNRFGPDDIGFWFTAMQQMGPDSDPRPAGSFNLAGIFTLVTWPGAALAAW